MEEFYDDPDNNNSPPLSPKTVVPELEMTIPLLMKQLTQLRQIWIFVAAHGGMALLRYKMMEDESQYLKNY